MCNIIDFVNKYYHVAFQGEDVDSSNLENVEFFLLADIHDHWGVERVNGAFVDRYANPEKDVVLVEEIPSMCETSQKKHTSTVWLNGEFKTLGWDLSEDILELDEQEERITLFQLQTRLLAKKVEHLSKLEQQITILDSITREDAIAAMLERKYRLTQEKAFYVVRRVWETIEERNLAMIETLQKVKNSFQKKFLIAGIGHLTEEMIHFWPSIHGFPFEQGFPSDPRFSLDPLRECLRKRKAVILVPKLEQCQMVQQQFDDLRMFIKDSHIHFFFGILATSIKSGNYEGIEEFYDWVKKEEEKLKGVLNG